MSRIVLTFSILLALLMPAPASSQAAACEGTVHDTRTGDAISWDDALERLRVADVVGVGERHGIAAHVALGACVLAQMAQNGPVALALEHIPADRQEALEQGRSAGTPEAIAEAVDWTHSGWPDFALYSPLFAEALAAHSPIVATDRPKGRDADASRRKALLLAAAPSFGDAEAPVQTAWIPTMIEGHCGLIDEDVARMVAGAQMERDRIMAGRVLEALNDTGRVLYYSGKGHQRRDRAVPFLLGRSVEAPTMVVVAAYADGEIDIAPPSLRALAPLYDLVVVGGKLIETDEEACVALREKGMGR